MGAPDADEPPLVVDVDGTLLRTDLLVESGLGALGRNVLTALRIPAWLAGGRARLKHELAARAPLDPAELPYDEAVLAHLRAQRASGRAIYLASAADRAPVAAIAEHLGLFDGVFASDGTHNLKGAAKARALVEAFGGEGFDYIGNDRADMAVWRVARRAGLAGARPAVERAVAGSGRDYEVIARHRSTPRSYVRALRPHQWLKNLLVYVPVLAAHDLTASNMALATLAFVAFSLVASGVYVLNDLLDLPSDRAHPRKRERPFASGAIPIVHGLALSPVLVLAGFAVAITVEVQLLAVLLLYFVLTTAYSLYLKRQALLDVLTLAGLYTLRVLGGGAAVALAVSEWLLALSLFLFLALAIVKRYAELIEVAATEHPNARGRGYAARDLPVLAALGAAAGYSAVLVLALYTQTSQVQALYDRPALLWGVCALLLYWISRMLLISHRGGMHDDPLVFAVQDRASLAVLVLAAALVLVAV